MMSDEDLYDIEKGVNEITVMDIAGIVVMIILLGGFLYCAL